MSMVGVTSGERTKVQESSPVNAPHGVRSSQVGSELERCAQALQGVTEAALCRGCGRSFRPARVTQVHCRPGCRVAALRQRRASRS